ncbi:MAG: DNA translocase FtsK [Candidatus Symbiothrix sp.]|jgi:S-DNA-T family DNA segregation ATPase FtsK/SpoIIIE|nr:DNA translocase FtsK [Candidatus Symbiothrix sp.]
MAKKTSVPSKDAKAGTGSKLQAFFKSSATHYISGLCIGMFALFACLSMISFFFTGADDQSLVEGKSLFYFGRIAGIHNWMGTRGALLSNILMNKWFGVSNIFLLAFLIFLALRLMKARYFHLFRNFVICTVLTIWTSVALSFFFRGLLGDTFFSIGGAHGDFMSRWLVENLGKIGAFFIILLTLVITLTVISPKTIPFLISLTAKKQTEKDDTTGLDDYPFSETAELEEPEKKHWFKKLFSWASLFGDSEEEDGEETPEELLDHKPQVLIVDETTTSKPFVPKSDPGDFTIINALEKKEENLPEELPHHLSTTHPEHTDGDEEGDRLLRELGVYDPTADLSHYQLPMLDFLKRYDSNDTVINMAEQNENKNRIISTLEQFKIGIKNITATVGPTITLYEIVPEDGIRVSKIKNLEDDIAMSLSAMGIRIIAPMPGKGTIGIEVPNKDAKIVSMYSIIASKKYQESHYELPIALGKTITNEVFMVDLAKMPHLLVAGATGQGKSVGLNAAITSLLYKKHPAELKFVLIDPKMVEFSIYSTIEKHFLATLPDAERPIITDFTKVIHTLNSLTKEMDDRYRLLEKVGSRNVKEYNEKFINRRLNPNKGHRYMPYIVVIIDEFGDLIMTAGKEIELPIARIAQKARAVGIHMIIATQRPTTNIITGTIKANFPARVAFRVTSAIDSRTILDGGGANQLIGRGDLLFSQGSELTRVQCAFVDTPEVEKISKFIGNQQGYPTTYPLPEPTVGEGGSDFGGGSSMGGGEDLDPLFEESARLIVIHQQGSTSLIQRKFSIGYNRAGRLMDQLERAGVVGPTQGSKPREVYIQDEAGLDRILGNIRF